MTGVSSNVMCGQQGYFGTGAFQVLLNMDEINKLENTNIEEKININDMLGVDESGQYCSTNNITINSSVTHINSIIQVILMMTMI